MRRVAERRPRSRSISKRAVGLAAAAAALCVGFTVWAIPALARAVHLTHPAAARRADAATTTTSASTTGTGAATTPSTPAVGPGSSAQAKAGRAPNYVGVWSRSFSVQRPINSDMIPPILTVSAGGGLAVGAGTTDENNTAGAKANLVTGTVHNAFSGRQAVSGQQQILALAYLGPTLNLLTGTSPQYSSCCSTAGIQLDGTSGISSVQPLASGLLGASTGALVPVHSGLLAALANQAGIWVRRSSGGTYGSTDQLSGANQEPPAVISGDAVVAWTAPRTGSPAGNGTATATATTTVPSTPATTTSVGVTYPVNQEIVYVTLPKATGGLPGARRVAITVPSNKQVDAISLAQHGNGETIAWTESWFGSTGVYASQVFWADLNGTHTATHALSTTQTTAVGVSIASAGQGRQVMTWQACDNATGTCQLEAALRPHGGAWGPVQAFGAIDPTSFPVAAAGTDGESLLGWTDQGNVYAMSAAPETTTFNKPVELSRAGDDSNVQIAFSSNSHAVAVWQEGILHPELAGARFTPITYTRKVTTATGGVHTVTTSTTPAPR